MGPWLSVRLTVMTVCCAQWGHRPSWLCWVQRHRSCDMHAQGTGDSQDRGRTTVRRRCFSRHFEAVRLPRRPRQDGRDKSQPRTHCSCYVGSVGTGVGAFCVVSTRPRRRGAGQKAPEEKGQEPRGLGVGGRFGSGRERGAAPRARAGAACSRWHQGQGFWEGPACVPATSSLPRTSRQ